MYNKTFSAFDVKWIFRSAVILAISLSATHCRSEEVVSHSVVGQLRIGISRQRLLSFAHEQGWVVDTANYAVLNRVLVSSMRFAKVSTPLVGIFTFSGDSLKNFTISEMRGLMSTPGSPAASKRAYTEMLSLVEGAMGDPTRTVNADGAIWKQPRSIYILEFDSNTGVRYVATRTH